MKKFSLLAMASMAVLFSNLAPAKADQACDQLIGGALEHIRGSSGLYKNYVNYTVTTVTTNHNGTADPGHQYTSWSHGRFAVDYMGNLGDQNIKQMFSDRLGGCENYHSTPSAPFCLPTQPFAQFQADTIELYANPDSVTVILKSWGDATRQFSNPMCTSNRMIATDANGNLLILTIGAKTRERIVT